MSRGCHTRVGRRQPVPRHRLTNRSAAGLSRAASWVNSCAAGTPGQSAGSSSRRQPGVLEEELAPLVDETEPGRERLLVLVRVGRFVLDQAFRDVRPRGVRRGEGPQVPRADRVGAEVDRDGVPRRAAGPAHHLVHLRSFERAQPHAGRVLGVAEVGELLAQPFAVSPRARRLEEDQPPAPVPRLGCAAVDASRGLGQSLDRPCRGAVARRRVDPRRLEPALRGHPGDRRTDGGLGDPDRLEQPDQGRDGRLVAARSQVVAVHVEQGRACAHAVTVPVPGGPAGAGSRTTVAHR